MNTVSIAGPIDPFFDPSTGAQVRGSLNGTMWLESAGGDLASGGPQVHAAVLRTTSKVLSEKLAAGQVAVPTLTHSLGHYAQEIAQRSGAEQLGLRITGLQIALTLDQAAPVQPPQQQLPPNPQEAMNNAINQRMANMANPNNWEVRGEVEIGGVDVGFSSKHGINEKQLEERVKDKVASEVQWFAIGCAVIAFLVIGGVGLAGYIFYVAKKSVDGEVSAEAEMALWDGREPFSCGGTDHVRLVGVTATLASGTAVTAGSNCVVELVNCTITAPDGISALGNAQVIVEGGTITSSNQAASALGNATITFRGTTVTGPTQALGNARIVGP